MKQPKEPIGAIVLSMKGRLSNKYNDYYDVKSILDSWNENKTYWATKKNYKIFQKSTVFGVSSAEIIDTWLTRGYEVETKFKNLVEGLKHSASH